METKFYKLITSNELMNYEISNHIDRFEDGGKDRISEVSLSVLSSLISAIASNQLINLENLYLRTIIFIGAAILGFFCLNWLLHRICDLIKMVHNVFIKKENTSKEIQKKQDVFYKLIQNQIVMALSLSQKIIFLWKEIEVEEKRKVKYYSENQMNYQRSLIKIYFSKLIYYLKEAGRSIDYYNINQSSSSEFADQTINAIGQQAMIDLYQSVLTEVDDLQKCFDNKEVAYIKNLKEIKQRYEGFKNNLSRKTNSDK